MLQGYLKQLFYWIVLNLRHVSDRSDIEDKFGILVFLTFSAILWLICDQPVVTGEGSQSTRRKNTALPQVTGNFLTFPVWDSNPCSGERQLAVCGNALDHTAIRAGPQMLVRIGLTTRPKYPLNPSNAKRTLFQSTRTRSILKAI